MKFLLSIDNSGINSSSNALFDNILNDLSGIVKDNSKLGTLVGSPRGAAKLKDDFTANQFEDLDKIDEANNDGESSSSSDSRSDGEEQSNQQLDESALSFDDYDQDEMEFEEKGEEEGNASGNRNVTQFGYGFNIGVPPLNLQDDRQNDEEEEGNTARSSYRPMNPQSNWVNDRFGLQNMAFDGEDDENDIEDIITESDDGQGVLGMRYNKIINKQ